MHKDLPKVTSIFEKASKFFVSKDNRHHTFQNITRPQSTVRGDYIYMMADKTIFVFFITEHGQLDTTFAVSGEGSDLNTDDLTRVMVQDQNIMTLCAKEITVFQFQNNQIQQKQKFAAFKDVEDIAISRVDGVRIFKVKGSKGKFKVFSTLPSSDWNPYIEGVSKTTLLNDREFPKIELLNGEYGNVVIMAYTGKHYKYFVVGSAEEGQRDQLLVFRLRRDLQLQFGELHEGGRDEKLSLPERGKEEAVCHCQAIRLQRDADRETDR